MSVLHVRLRNKCSGLNSDLFRNHIRNNPLCELFDVAEDGRGCPPLLLSKQKNYVERQVFNDTVRGFQSLNINVILYGNENWNSEANMTLFRALHRYIHTPPNALNNLLGLCFKRY